MKLINIKEFRARFVARNLGDGKMFSLKKEKRLMELLGKGILSSDEEKELLCLRREAKESEGDDDGIGISGYD